MPAKHNDTTEALLKKTKEFYTNLEEEFKVKSKSKLEERLRVFDQRIEDYN